MKENLEERIKQIEQLRKLKDESNMKRERLRIIDAKLKDMEQNKKDTKEIGEE